MNLRLRNNWKLAGEDRWKWSVFLEDDASGEIDKVKSVQYILHPTFKNPIQLRENRENKFALNASGWGTFMIKAFVNMEDGERIKLEHELELFYDPESGETE